MAKTIIEILQEQAEIADNFAAMAQRVAPEIPIMEFPEIPRWNPEIPIMQIGRASCRERV